MPDATTLAVLQDVVCICVLAALIGAGVYTALRSVVPVALLKNQGRRTAQGTNEWLDVPMAFLIVALMAGSLFTTKGLEKSVVGETAKAVSDLTHLQNVAEAVMWTLALVALLIGYLRAVRECDPAEVFGLRRLTVKKALIKALIWIVPAVVVVMAVAVLSDRWLEGLLPDNDKQAAVKLLEDTKSPLVKMAMTFMAVIVAPLAEEIMFRGFIFGVLRRYTDTVFAGLISALLFAAVHVHLGSFLPLFVLGLFFVMAYEATGCLLVSMFMHALFNAGQIVMMQFDKS
ncbi:MAG: amino terminal protease self-immunity [Verrucomicrobiaceae bacterium]|nr:amino terminal protease self-immunity [Verrucomicrobiaceae bacterium]